jgi:hypothetical protein
VCGVQLEVELVEVDTLMVVVVDDLNTPQNSYNTTNSHTYFYSRASPGVIQSICSLPRYAPI